MADPPTPDSTNSPAGPSGRCPHCGAAHRGATGRSRSSDDVARSLDPSELLDAASGLVGAAKRLESLVSDVEWFVQPWRLDGPDEYSDLREHVDAAGREARAASRVLYMIGQDALRSSPPPPDTPPPDSEQAPDRRPPDTGPG